ALGERDEARTERDTALGERDQARTERDTALGERDQARTERDTALGERDQARTERDTAIGDLALAQDIIEDARKRINDDADTLPDAVTQLEGLVAPVPDSSNIYLRSQEIIEAFGPSSSAIAAMLQEVNDKILGRGRAFGQFPGDPDDPLQTIPQLVSYVTYSNLNHTGS
ncbi:MAG: hypothetical protein IBJ00_03780, partial [Alphaproteobacteria bacterium]|nr:hypothetical protein [Alphaproteobacteria bacterium]